MNVTIRKKMTGFTLIEMLLVLIVITVIINATIGYLQQQTLRMQVNRAAFQMEQIMSASTAYYINYNSWPSSVATLQSSGFLPSVSYSSPWGTNYSISSSQALLTVTLPLVNMSNEAEVANLVAGKLPLAAPQSTSVLAFLAMPAQGLSNATAVNFAGIYPHGGCVPVPTCPLDSSGNTMTPQILVAPVSVSGLDLQGGKVWPITSFTAYATVNTGANYSTNTTTPPDCDNTFGYNTSNNCADPSNSNGPVASAYWRVCLQIKMTYGSEDVGQQNGPSGHKWGNKVQIMAITQCVPQNQSGGSPMSVYSN